MRVIGLTGGIGSGKSTVSRFLAEFGAVIIDADKVGHELFKSDNTAVNEVAAVFGKQILTPGGDIDRKQLSDMVFENPETLSRLNQITHPRMKEIVESRLEEYKLQGKQLVVLEAPLLIEASWTSLVDEVWVTVASEATILKRLEKRGGGLAREESLKRIRSQLSAAERAKYADIVIDTDCTLDELKSKVSRLWQRLQKSAKAC